ncbi:MAG TPA: dihydrodipicolinate synthase family protein [Candidatus Binatus sp.]|jgi:4-hydroxy-tetrahydrodipicolinate synthase|nr:dihydrodipicolinate synthase family protein [Candidatus Binatus sp.]
MMQTTRRDFLGVIGVAAALGVVGETRGADVHTAATNRPAGRQPDVAPGSGDKQLFWVAASTPCDKNLTFDAELYKDVLAYLKQNGADGVVVLGTTGEFPSFSVAERKKIAEVAFKNRNGLNIIVSPGTANLPETLELSLHAQENGADGLLVVPPFYYKHPKAEGLNRYFSMLFEKVQIPINLYHIPFATGIPISLDLLHSLEKYPNLAGIKDSSSDEEEYHKFVAEFPKLNMRTGTTHNLKHAMDTGMGAILAEGNNFTALIAAVFAAKRSGKDMAPPLAKLDAALKLLRAGGVDEYGPMKYALALQMGTRQFYQRPPNADVTEEQKTKIKEALEEIKKMG